MELVPIGEAARRLGLNASALETLDRRVAGESLDDLAAEHDVTGAISEQ